MTAPETARIDALRALCRRSLAARRCRLPRKLRVADVLEAVSEAFGVEVAVIIGPSRRRIFTAPRHAAMLLACEFTGHSLAGVGRCIGGRDHSTVSNGVARALQLCDEDPDYGETVDALRTALSQFQRALADGEGLA